MSDFVVEVITQEICECLQKIAIKNHFSWERGLVGINYSKKKFLHFHIKTGRIIYDDYYTSGLKPLHGVKDFAEIVRRLEEKPPTKVRLGDYEGEIRVDGEVLTVDCQEIPYTEVKNACVIMERIMGEK